MSGVDPNFISHSLNIKKDSKPVVQKVRCLAPEHAEAVVDKVNRLLEANAIQEVQYPTLLSKTMVDRKEKEWQMESPC